MSKVIVALILIAGLIGLGTAGILLIGSAIKIITRKKKQPPNI